MNEGKTSDIASRWDQDHIDGDDAVVFMNEEFEKGGIIRRPSGDTRKNLTNYLDSNAIIRRPKKIN